MIGALRDDGRGLGRSEIPGARRLHHSVHQGREIEADLLRRDGVGAVLSKAGKAVDLQNVEIPLRVETHVHAGAVIAPQGREGAQGDILGFFRQLLADRSRTEPSDLPTRRALLVIDRVDGRAALSKNDFAGRQRHGRIVAEKADVDFSPFDILLHENRLLEKLINIPNRLMTFLLSRL